MPELPEEMYCHQQICIPPTFPYLLRQYAKAAIRSQPTDLLKWSTAYFRCLSLNVPPPVKPRLEYPIPRDYVGVTPGWLRALNYQLQNNQTIPFKILWDRWIGACLEHDTLIKILCLGGFTDANAIPWNRFLGLCAGHLTDNLTQTMILFCEIITEEPEGGSAMITLETFLDVYKFLAAIDASHPQTLINLYFTDSALNLITKEKKKALKEPSLESEPTIESSTPTPEEVVEEQEPIIEILGEGSIISCPDILSDDALQEPEIDEDKRSDKSDEFVSLKKPDEEDEDEEAEDDEMKRLAEESALSRDDEGSDVITKPGSSQDIGSMEPQGSDIVPVSPPEEGGGEETGVEGDMEVEGEGEPEVVEETKEKERDEDEEIEGEEPTAEVKEEGEGVDEEEDGGKSTIEKQMKLVEQDICEKGGIELIDDYIVDEQELEEETPSVPSMEFQEISGEGGFYGPVDELEEHIRIKYRDAAVVDELGQEEEVMEEEEPPEEVQVDAIPGIGPIVPQELVNAVEKYLTAVSTEEHGMTMPRHVRHYTCPPLEVYQ